MKMKKIALLAVGVAIMVSVQSVAVGAETTTAEIAKKLSSKKPLERQGAIGQAVKRRQKLISAVLKIAREAKDIDAAFGKKECAIELLGELRATEAVEFLVEHISIKTATPVLDLTEYDGLPCVEALVKIGNPSAKAIWTKYLPASTKKKLPLYLKVMKGVWGKETCTLLLNAKLKTKLPKGAKANFEAALKYFQPEKAKEKPKKDERETD